MFFSSTVFFARLIKIADVSPSWWLTQQRLTFGKHKGKTFKEALQTTLDLAFLWRSVWRVVGKPKIMEDDLFLPQKMGPKGWFRRWIHGQPYRDADLSSHLSYLGQEKQVRIPTMGEYIVRCTYVYCRISFVKNIHVYAHVCYVYVEATEATDHFFQKQTGIKMVWTRIPTRVRTFYHATKVLLDALWGIPGMPFGPLSSVLVKGWKVVPFWWWRLSRSRSPAVKTSRFSFFLFVWLVGIDVVRIDGLLVCRLS